jgi:hemolysin activation/secretion protein
LTLLSHLDCRAADGDNGLAASLEVRYDQAVQHTFITGYQLYTFVDL